MNKRCVPSCSTSADCQSARRGQWALPECETNPLGCWCDVGRCEVAVCTSDSQCGTQVCRSGSCVDPPDAGMVTVAACRVVPDFLTMRAGTAARFSVVAFDAIGGAVAPTSEATWAATSAAVTGGGTGPSQVFTAAAAVAVQGPASAIRATVGSVTCDAKVQVFPAVVPVGQLVAVAWDEATGRPITGAHVVASDADGGVLDGPATTDSHGAATVNVTGVVTLSVFHADFDVQTIAHYDTGSATPDARTLAFPLRRNPLDRFGGVKGTLTAPPATQNVHYGFVGAAQASFVELLPQAADVTTRVRIGAINQDVALPTRLYFGFDTVTPKSQWSTLAPSGPCWTGTGAPNEAAITDGSCGTTALWGLVGDLPLSEIPVSAIAGGTSNTDWPATMVLMNPVYRRLQSVVRRDVSYPLAAAPRSTDGGVPDLDVSNTSAHVVHDLPFSGLSTGPLVLAVPALPQLGGRPADAVLARGYALAPGHGLLALGFGAGANVGPPDPFVDAQSPLDAGFLPLSMAPASGGAEGSDYRVVATAVDTRTWSGLGGFVPDRLPLASAVVARVAAGQLTFDPLGAAPLALPAFIPSVENGRYNFASAPMGVLPARTFVAPGVQNAVATEARLVFTDLSARRWVVRVAPEHLAAGVTLPVPPAGHRDRTSWEGSTLTARSNLRVDLLKLDDGRSIDFVELAELNAVNADRMTELMQAFSTNDLGRPSLAWKAPAPGTSTLGIGSTLRVHVEHFKVGTGSSDDGVVHFSFGGRAGCPDANVSTADLTGVGDYSLALPLSCSGQGVQVTASLFDTTGTSAVVPPVLAGITVTIQ